MRTIMRIGAFVCVSFLSLSSAVAGKIFLIAENRSAEKMEMTQVQHIKIVQGERATMSALLTNGDEKSGLSVVAFGDLDIPATVASANAESIAVYPNPVSERLFISGVGENPNVSVLDMSGKVVVSCKSAEVNVSVLPSGTYIITVNGACAKFIKN